MDGVAERLTGKANGGICASFVPEDERIRGVIQAPVAIDQIVDFTIDRDAIPSQSQMPVQGIDVVL